MLKVLGVPMCAELQSRRTGRPASPAHTLLPCPRLIRLICSPRGGRCPPTAGASRFIRKKGHHSPHSRSICKIVHSSLGDADLVGGAPGLDGAASKWCWDSRLLGSLDGERMAWAWGACLSGLGCAGRSWAGLRLACLASLIALTVLLRCALR